MLQQGRFVADILYYYGDDSNLTALFGEKAPDVSRRTRASGAGTDTGRPRRGRPAGMSNAVSNDTTVQRTVHTIRSQFLTDFARATEIGVANRRHLGYPRRLRPLFIEVMR